MNLTDPFDVVHQRPQGNIMVDYVQWSQVADRLDEASAGWSFAIIQLGPDWCHGRLTLGDGRGFENIGYGDASKKEGLKDAVSDALKRCAAMAGVARYLYDKDDSQSPAAAPRPHPGAAGSSPRSAAPTPRPVQSTTPEEPADMWEGKPNAGTDARPLSTRDLFNALEAQGIDVRAAGQTAKQMFGVTMLKDLTDAQRGDLFAEIAS